MTTTQMTATHRRWEFIDGYVNTVSVFLLAIAD
jgi:hypothetical protein